MIELTFTANTDNYMGNHVGMLGTEINTSDNQGVISCEISSENNQSETLELTIDENGYFSILTQSQPINLLVDGNLLIEANDFNNIQTLEFTWNPISKILIGRMPI